MIYTKIDINDSKSVSVLSKLASKIVKEHFDPLIGSQQNDYMIQKFQSVTAIKEQLQHGYQYFFVCDDENKKAGFLAFYKRGNEVYLSKFYLKKEYRGMGISKDMLKFVILKTKEIKLNSIVLNVNRDNSAIYAYEKLGFKKIREEKNEIGHGFIMDDFVYEYKIDML